MSTSKGRLLSMILFPEQMVFKYDEELPIVVGLLLCYAAVCFAMSLIFQVCTIRYRIFTYAFFSVNAMQHLAGRPTRKLPFAVPERTTKHLDYQMELLHRHYQSDYVTVASCFPWDWTNLCIWAPQGKCAACIQFIPLLYPALQTLMWNLMVVPCQILVWLEFIRVLVEITYSDVRGWLRRTLAYSASMRKELQLLERYGYSVLIKQGHSPTAGWILLVFEGSRIRSSAPPNPLWNTISSPISYCKVLPLATPSLNLALSLWVMKSR